MHTLHETNKPQQCASNDAPDLEVQGLLKELDSLSLPYHLESPVRTQLAKVQAINGTTDPTQIMFKQILFGLAHSAVMHFRYVKETQQNHTDACILNKQVKYDDEGHFIPPWKADIEAVDAKIESMRNEVPVTTELAAEPDSFFFGIPKWRLGIGATGKASSVIGSRVVTGLFVLGVVFLYGYIQNRRFTEAIDERISTLAMQARQLADIREEKAEARSKVTQKLIQNYEPEDKAEE